VSLRGVQGVGLGPTRVVIIVLAVESGEGSGVMHRGARGWLGRGRVPFIVVVAVLVCGLVFVAGASATGDLTNGSCPNEASPGFRSYLPECRAYELVTPVFKNGTEMLTSAISEDGSSLLAVSLSGFAGAEANANGTNGGLYRLVRSASGWTVTAVSPSSSAFPAQTWVAASPDLASTLWVARTPLESSFAENLYIREAGGVMVRIGSMVPPATASGPPSGEFQMFPFAGGSRLVVLDESDDLSHVFYSTYEGQKVGLAWPNDTTVNEGRSLYEYSGTGQSRPELVGVSDGSTVVAGENEGKPLPAGRLISTCSTYLGSKEAKDLYNAVSANGSTVFFTAEQGGCGGGEGPEVNELYARVDQLQTVPISEPTVVACAACDESVRAPAAFAGASQDGSKVFFLTKQQLLAGTTGSGESLYEYDFDAANGGRVTRVSSGSGEPNVLGVARVSEDGSHVYFVAEGRLSNGARGGGVVGGSEGPCLAELGAGEKALEMQAEEEEAKSEPVTVGSRCRPTLGGPNLYAFEQDSTYPSGRVSFVATLTPGDEGDWQATDNREVQATPDGRLLVFQSRADLVAGDTSSTPQVFEYDALTGELARVSSEQAGFTPEEANLDANENGSQISGYSYAVSTRPTRSGIGLAVSADGAVVEFASEAALTAGAVTAAKAKAQSAYEYRNSVAGGGTVSEGDVYLISDGVNVRSPGETAIGVDASGGDVFFGSADELVPGDSDSQFDTYDARVGGGFPAAAPVVGCVAVACEGVLYSPPAAAQPSGSAVGAPGASAGVGASPSGSPAGGRPAVVVGVSREVRLVRALRVCARERGRLRVRCEALALARYGKKHKHRSLLGVGGAGR
jgi:hypothetical protein